MASFPDIKSTPIKNIDLANRLLDYISAVSHVINSKRLKYTTKLNRILKLILDYLDAEQGSIMILEKKDLIIKASTRKELIDCKQSLDEDCVACWVAKTRKPLFVPDINKDKRFKSRRSDNYKKKSFLSVPIANDKKIIGVINVSDKTGSKDLLKEDIVYLLDFSSLVLALIMQEKLHSELRKQKNNLKKRNMELRRQEVLRAELSKMLVHDLKGPLSEVVANLDILSYSISEEEKDFLESAQIGCDKAVRMISNLVTVGKLEDGKMQLLKDFVRPEDLINESVSSVKGLAKIKNVELELDVENDLEPVRVDRTLILRVLQNLLTNALGYTPENSKVTISCRSLSPRKKIVFSIKDQGPGIPKEQHAMIFEKYARLTSQNDAMIGTGLGLFFCKLVVEEHRGAIEVANEPEGGSRFHFTVPQ